MRDLIWTMDLYSGRQIVEVTPDGSELLFEEVLTSEERGRQLKVLSLVDLKAQTTHSVNMVTGEFSLGGGAPFAIAKEVDGRTFRINGLPDAKYALNAVQYKLCNPVPIGVNGEVSMAAMSIGYQVDIPPWLCAYREGDDIVTLTRVRAVITVECVARLPHVSATFWAKRVMKDDSIVSQRF